MKSICFFNNKGGVGKTTLVCNIASYIADHHPLKVVVIDADPQCNATQLILHQKLIDTLYSPKKNQPTNIARPSVRYTLYDVLQPIARGDSHIAETVVPLLGSRNRFHVDLIPCHPKIAILEDQFSQAWLNFGGGDLGGVRRTNWNTQLMAKLRDQYDLAFIDVGPSLGALNRSVLIGVDYFVTPMGCDIFSIIGIDNISSWLREWLKWYERSLQTCKEKWQDLGPGPIRQNVSSVARFIGYTVQQYITKSKEGERRPTKAYERIMKRIPAAVTKELGPYVPSDLDKARLRLGDVPNMFSLVPLAQDANAPLHSLESSDGLVGAQYSQKTRYVEFINALATSLLKNLSIEELA